VVAGRPHAADPGELLRTLDAPERDGVGGRAPAELRASGERLLALHAPKPRRQRREPAGRRRAVLLVGGDSAAGGRRSGGSVDEDAESYGGARGVQAVVLVAQVRELVVAGDRHDHVIQPRVGEAVPDCAHLRAAGHLRRQAGRQVAEGDRARHHEDARLAADVPLRAVGAAGREAAAVAARQLHPRVGGDVVAHGAGRIRRHQTS
jgi:hypothetical protein